HEASRSTPFAPLFASGLDHRGGVNCTRSRSGFPDHFTAASLSIAAVKPASEIGMVTGLRVTGAVHRLAETLSRSISCLAAIPDGKPLHTFPGIALNPDGARGGYG
ncbi:hypothetical protein, partial [Mesorhizobium sp. M4B.F.Ca.ET.089.01.1.1]|uniref:hypothetical protein n=1 Tax=Mesorhizobium sp. M4B.F.Ca.ET.089.01.1.1 TaxID=2496662 RepID=UPI001AECD28E